MFSVHAVAIAVPQNKSTRCNDGEAVGPYCNSGAARG
jgi:hypothetical protein